eukprot:GDKH01019690.1.p1 GENE.GDKH01019690.1~~GDKH01019690.1.p1  ORF type:complete len:473 (-),score=140.91 GDKH01019690.1:243-1661(-)
MVEASPVVPTSGQRLFSKFCFFMFGAAALFPYNSVLNTLDYFDVTAFPNHTWPARASQAYSTSCLIIQILLIKLGGSIMPSPRMYLGLIACGLLTAMIPASDVIFSDPELGFKVAIVSIVLVGVGNGMAQGSMFGVAGMLGGEELSYTMVGSGAAGVLCFIFAVVSKLSFSEDAAGQQKSVIMFFFISCIWVLSCVFLYVCLERVPWVAAKLENLRRSRVQATSVREVSGSVGPVEPEPEADSKTEPLNRSPPPVQRSHDIAALVDVETPNDDAVTSSELDTNRDNASARGLGAIFADAWPMMVCEMFVFIITFMIFPALSVNWYTDGAAYFPRTKVGQGWFVLCVVGAFQIGDLVGRYMPALGAMLPAWSVKWFVGSRLLLVPVAMLCQHQDQAAFWGNDNVRLLLMFVVAVTNGWASTLAMIYGPDQVKSNAEKEIVGIAMVTSLLGGITVGSYAVALTQIGAPAAPILA